MKSNSRIVLSLLLASLFVPLTIVGQVATGTPPFSTIGGGPDEINLGNLNFHWAFPVFSKPGRGLPFTYSLGYNSSVWTNNGAGIWLPSVGWGWKGEGIGRLGTLANNEDLVPCGTSGRNIEDYNSWVYTDPSGVEHPFSGDVYHNECTGAWTPMTATATDGSGYSIHASNGVYAAITMPSGVTMNPVRVNSSGSSGYPTAFPESSGSVTDTNGNYLSAHPSGSSNAYYTDTLGMSVMSNSGVAPNPISFNYTDSNGATQAVVASFTNSTVQTNFGCSGVAEYGPASVPLITSLSYPDGSSYSFSYEQTPGYPGYVTGRIQTVTLRTGGTITYTYTGANDGIMCTDGSSSGFSRQTSDGTISYSRSSISLYESQTSVTDEQGNLTNLWFQEELNSSNFYETERQVYQGSSSLLETLQTCYNGASPDCTATTISLPITQKTVLTQLPSGSQKESITYFNNAGLTTETDTYDWGSNPTATLLKKVVISYASLSNNILDRPYQITTSNSAQQLAQTTYTYDEGTPSATSNVPQHSPISGSRGNATTISEWLNTGGSLTTHKSYDDTGNVLSVTDPGGHITQYSYTDNFQDNINRYSLAYVTQTTEPATGSVQHITSAKYDANTGLRVNQTDENNQVTSFQYDGMLRSTQVSYPDGGQTVKNYPNATTIETKQKQDGANWIDQYLYLDGYGRQSQTRSIDPEGDDYTDTTYDAVHRTVSVTNPHRSVGASTDGTNTTAYDALGRITRVTHPDGNTVQTDYSNFPTVVVTDETQRKRQSTSDGLGRLTQVIEPNPGTGSLTAGAYPTNYTYDALSNLTYVNQIGDSTGARTRSFSYDSASRLLSASNPESGTINYAYTVDPTCNPDGLLSSMTDARGISTTYCYDALHRVTKKSYSDGSASREFSYDQGSHGYSIGRLTHASNDVNAAYDPTYDVMGRVTSQAYCIPSDCSYGVSVSALYDLAGHLTWLTYPDGRKIQNSFSAAGRETKVNYDSFAGTPVNSPFLTVAQGSAPSNWGYSPVGSLQLARFGNSVTETMAYNNRLQISLIAQATNAQTLFSKSYNYIDGSHGNGNNGNVIGITDNLTSSHNQSFSYDQLNRIIAGSQSDSAFSQTFSYDPWGNLNQSGTWNFLQSFAGTNRIQGYSYDAAGDLLNDTIHGYGYDAERRIKTVDGTGATYTYGPDGERVRKDSGSSWTEYVEFGSNTIAEKNASGWTDYVFANNQRIAMSSSSSMSSTQYYHADHLGTARMMTDASGNVISNCLYAPFGQEASCSPSNAVNHYKFTGKERDSESYLDYFGARYYSNSMGRFMTPDNPEDDTIPAPIPYADLNDPQTLNLYSYVRDNPLSHVDPDGHAVQICTPNTGPGGGQNCTWVSDDDYKKAQQGNNPGINAPELGKSGDITCGGQVCGSVRYVPGSVPGSGMDNGGMIPGMLGPGDLVLFGMRGMLSGGSASTAVEGAAAGAARGAGSGLLTATEGALLSNGTKAAAKQIIEGMAESAQKASLKRALAAAGNSAKITIQELPGGSVRVMVYRAGVDGGQTMMKTVAADGTSSTVQVAIDGAGNLVHYDPK